MWVHRDQTATLVVVKFVTWRGRRVLFESLRCRYSLFYYRIKNNLSRWLQDWLTKWYMITSESGIGKLKKSFFVIVVTDQSRASHSDITSISGAIKIINAERDTDNWMEKIHKVFYFNYIVLESVDFQDTFNYT